MSKVRRFALDEITIRPGTYFNPQTEVMIVVDDSPRSTTRSSSGTSSRAATGC